MSTKVGRWVVVLLLPGCAAGTASVGPETEGGRPGEGGPAVTVGPGQQAQGRQLEGHPQAPVQGEQGQHGEQHGRGPLPRGQCEVHALAPPEGIHRPGHPAAYEPDALVDARAERIRPSPGMSLRPGEVVAEVQNGQHELLTNCGGTSCAWQYVPSTSYLLERVELHGDSAEVALLADDCGRPGQLLARAATGQSNDPGWVSASFEQPLRVEAGRPYWLWHSPGRCSIVAGGSRQVYWCNFHEMAPDGWEGPWRSFAWTARLYGSAAAGSR